MLIPLLVLSLSIVLFGWKDSAVRYAGLVLEVLGLWTVLEGHNDKRKFFDKPTFIENFKSLARQFPSWKPRTTSATGTFSGSFRIEASGRGYQWHEAISDSVIDRLEALDQNLLSLRDDLKIFEKNVGAKNSELDKKIVAVETELLSALAEIKDKLEKFAVGGVAFEAAGIIWLFFGLVLSSLSSEISTLF